MNPIPEVPSQPGYKVAIVQAQVLIALFAVATQLFLLTVIVERFLLGDTSGILALLLASAIAFIFAAGIWYAHR